MTFAQETKSTVKRIWPLVNWLLIVWGAVSLIAVLIAGISIARRFSGYESTLGSSNVDSSAKASKQDVRFVLNWCRLGDSRIEEVIHSYQSARSFTGDHLDAHAIRITNVSTDELVADDFGGGWVRCDKAQGVLKDALDFVTSWAGGDETPWFPPAEQLKSADFYVYSWSIYCHGTRPSAAELIFVHPASKMVYYFGGKT